MSVLASLETLIFLNAVAEMVRETEREKLSIFREVVNGTMACMAVQFMQKVSDALTKSSSLGSL